MNKLMKKKPVLHAVLWILIYIVSVNIGEALNEATGAGYWTSALVLILSGILLIYLKKISPAEAFGLKKITKEDAYKVLFYVPLILLAFIQFAAGITPGLSFGDTASICVLMVGVGFVEELLFRGFLFNAIYEKSGVKRAIVISGITFGIGHIVNLFRGYDFSELSGQIVVAVVVGLVLALLVAITRNLVPGILFHILFNISGSLANQGGNAQDYLLIAILTIAGFYAIYLFRFLRLAEKFGYDQHGQQSRFDPKCGGSLPDR